MNYTYESLELYHHGINGMKWGIRRYQNKDGSLTEKGKARYREVAADYRKQNRDTKDAISVYSSEMKKHGVLATGLRNRSEKAYAKADKYVTKSEKAQAKGNDSKFQKYQSKAWKQIGKSLEYDKKANIESALADQLSNKISDINAGRVKAGEDFIVQRDYNVSALILPGHWMWFWSSPEKRVIEKKKD